MVRLTAENENGTENARIFVTALDSAGVSYGVQWDYKLKKCEGHKFQPMTNKFNMMSDQLKAAAASNNLDETDQDEVSLLLEW